jgi:hypothetical protein
MDCRMNEHVWSPPTSVDHADLVAVSGIDLDLASNAYAQITTTRHVSDDHYVERIHGMV